MKTIAAGFGKQVNALMRCEVYLEKLTGDIEQLKQGKSPPGYKIFKAPDNPFLEEAMGEEFIERMGMMGSISTKDMSILAMKKTVHFEFMLLVTSLEFEVAMRKHVYVKEEGSFDKFVAEVLTSVRVDHDQVLSAAQKLGSPTRLFTSLEAQARRLAVNVYPKIVEHAAKTHGRRESFAGKRQESPEGNLGDKCQSQA